MKDAWSLELSLKDTATLLIALLYWINNGAPVAEEAHGELGITEDQEVRAADDCEGLIQSLQVPFDKV